MEIEGSENDNGKKCTGLSNLIQRSDFPDDFIFGSAGASYQFEGAAKKGGRGPSIWDDFTLRFPGKIRDGKNGNVAIDFYHQYKDDVKIMKKLGFDSYRFSISWSRLLPSGRLNGGVNKEGVKFYNDLIDELLANGIKPFVTLFHWDLPQVLEDQYGGFLDSSIVADFCEFADLCFFEFGDRVKYWSTLNEPWSYSNGGYVSGGLAPGRGHGSSTSVNHPSDEKHKKGIYTLHRSFITKHQPCKEGDPATEPYIVSHNLLLAHAATVALYKQKYQEAQKGKIGIVLNINWMVPFSSSKADREAANRALDFWLGWFMDPLINGDYPISMRTLVKDRLPKFSKEESEKVKGSFDYIGLNYYTANYVSDAPKSSNEEPSYATDSDVKSTHERNGTPIGQPSGSSWLYVYPQGIYDLLMYVKDKYKNPTIYITENGVSDLDDAKLTVKEACVDDIRKYYYLNHLRYIRAAMDDGADVKGYFAWSFMDNFEWAEGYTVRFGLIHVDYKDGELSRNPKDSAKWFMNFLKKDADAEKTLKRTRNYYDKELSLAPKNKKLALSVPPKGT